MAVRRPDNFVRRNDRCPCGSGKKFKTCCSPTAPDHRPRTYIHRTVFADTGERPVRWLITDNTTTRFFADKDNRALVFQDQAIAIAVATLEEFSEQTPGEINVAGVGETKWQHLQTKIKFVEIESIEQAVALVRERIEWGRAGELTPSEPLEPLNEESSDAEVGGSPAVEEVQAGDRSPEVQDTHGND